MTFGIGLSAGLRALTAARLGIETAGQNVANANTPGYSRQRILQSAAFPFMLGANLQIGTGVDVNGIRRIVDGGLERRIRMQLGVHGSAQVDFSRWSEIEAVFNEPDGGLSNNFTDFFGSIKKLQTQPANQALRGGAVQEGKSLASAVNQLARRFKAIESSSFTEIDGHIRHINELANSIAKLNDQIAVMEANGSTANDLRDTRERQIKEIGHLMEVTVLERTSGATDIQVGGLLLVSGNTVNTLEASRDTNLKTVITMKGNTAQITPTGGRIEGLLRHEASEIPMILGKLDKLAKNIALEFNRIHTTGVPLAGYYESSLGANAVKDINQNGVFGDDLLSNSGLPFDITKGEIYLSVSNTSTGDLKRTKIAINPASMSLQDVATAINAVDNVTASVDPAGRLRITANSGYGFDFSTRLDPNPDELKVFGGAQPSVSSSSTGPFNLTVPSTLRITIDGTNHDVSFTSAQFANPAQATVDEVTAAINATAGFSSAGVAANVGGRLVIRNNSTGTSASLTVSQPGPGTPVTQLGLPTGTFNGQAKGVTVTIGGKFEGKDNGHFSFVAEGTGTIGVTAGLTVGVFDKNGVKVATVDVGPNTKILDGPVKIADGITLELSAGSLTQGQIFAVDTLADSDTSDFLVAIGLNSMFHGSTADDLRINPDIENSPALLAASILGEEGDASNLERLIALRDQTILDLDNNTIEDFYNDVIGEIGFEASGAETILFAEDQLLAALDAQREAVSGVNLDEEMIDLVKFQQAFEAASRFINIVNELTNTLINLGR